MRSPREFMRMLTNLRCMAWAQNERDLNRMSERSVQGIVEASQQMQPSPDEKERLGRAKTRLDKKIK